MAASMLLGSGPLNTISIWGASCANAAINGGGRMNSTKSVPISVNVRRLVRGSNSAGSVVIRSTIAMSWPTCSSSSSARGVRASPCGLRTSNWSPNRYEAGQGCAHRRLRDAELLGGARHMALRQKHLQRHEQVEVKAPVIHGVDG